MTILFAPLHPLLIRLRAAGLTLPPQVVDAVDLLLANTDQFAVQLTPPAPDPLTADLATLADTIRARALYAVAREKLSPLVAEVLDEVAAAVGECLRDHADTILDQLRPRFDKAAGELHKASQLGLHAGITADTVIGLASPRAITAWRALPDHAATLDEVASIRLDLANVLEVAPEPNPFGPRQYGAAFDTAKEWTTSTHRYGVHRWLRLAADHDQPLHLLTIAETRRLDLSSREIPTPAAR